jgi:hypothetical protein
MRAFVVAALGLALLLGTLGLPGCGSQRDTEPVKVERAFSNRLPKAPGKNQPRPR